MGEVYTKVRDIVALRRELNSLDARIKSTRETLDGLWKQRQDLSKELNQTFRDVEPLARKYLQPDEAVGLFAEESALVFSQYAGRSHSDTKVYHLISPLELERRAEAAEPMPEADAPMPPPPAGIACMSPMEFLNAALREQDDVS